MSASRTRRAPSSCRCRTRVSSAATATGTLRARPSAFRTPGAEASGRLPAWVPPHLAGHFRAGRLGSVPAKQRGRAELLTRLAEAEFRPDRAHTEDEVSETLARYSGDPSALRRYCVEYRVLTSERDGSGYRLGGDAGRVRVLGGLRHRRPGPATDEGPHPGSPGRAFGRRCRSGDVSRPCRAGASAVRVAQATSVRYISGGSFEAASVSRSHRVRRVP
ncbi:DUF2087 domain-containing protein [Streptomyces sp. CLI2509]|uniref:DUF2087 domain-containing protein n=1 Tax=Streptomyces sp. CLI2509 TaxID=1984801 RepID=UPI001F1D513B|nr:DUF2087 domain-containing protein [Streptomyces sp. CLI2509]